MRYGTATFSNLQQKSFKQNPLVAIEMEMSVCFHLYES